MIPELGFCLGTRGQMFWLHDGLPNSLAPRKRPRTTLSPSFALRDGKPAELLSVQFASDAGIARATTPPPWR